MEVIWTEHWETWVRFFSSSSSILMTWKVMNSSGSRDSSIITEIIPWHTDTMISQTVSSKTENGNFRNSHKTYYRSVIATSSWSLLCVPIVIDPVSDHHKCVFCLWMSIRCWFGESARGRFGAGSGPFEDHQFSATKTKISKKTCDCTTFRKHLDQLRISRTRSELRRHRKKNAFCGVFHVQNFSIFGQFSQI